MFPYKGKSIEEATRNLVEMTRQCEEDWEVNGAKWSRSLGLRDPAYRKHKGNLIAAIEKMEESAALAA